MSVCLLGIIYSVHIYTHALSLSLSLSLSHTHAHTHTHTHIYIHTYVYLAHAEPSVLVSDTFNGKIRLISMQQSSQDVTTVARYTERTHSIVREHILYP